VKRCIIFILSFESCSILFSQTYVAFLGGYDFANISDYDSISIWETNLTIRENGFSIESPCIGIRLQKILTKEFSISVISDYTHKRLKATNLYGIAQFEAISFNYFRNNIAINYKLNDYNLGVAGCYNFINSLNYIYVNGAKDKFNTSTHESGIKIFGSWEYKKFELEIYYYSGFDSVNDESNKLHWKPIKAIGLLILYNLQL
jgi:hypothetical protein